MASIVFRYVSKGMESRYTNHRDLRVLRFAAYCRWPLLISAVLAFDPDAAYFQVEVPRMRDNCSKPCSLVCSLAKCRKVAHNLQPDKEPKFSSSQGRTFHFNVKPSSSLSRLAYLVSHGKPFLDAISSTTASVGGKPSSVAKSTFTLVIWALRRANFLWHSYGLRSDVLSNTWFNFLQLCQGFFIQPFLYPSAFFGVNPCGCLAVCTIGHVLSMTVRACVYSSN